MVSLCVFRGSFSPCGHLSCDSVGSRFLQISAGQWTPTLQRPCSQAQALSSQACSQKHQAQGRRELAVLRTGSVSLPWASAGPQCQGFGGTAGTGTAADTPVSHLHPSFSSVMIDSFLDKRLSLHLCEARFPRLHKYLGNMPDSAHSKAGRLMEATEGRSGLFGTLHIILRAKSCGLKHGCTFLSFQINLCLYDT